MALARLLCDGAAADFDAGEVDDAERGFPQPVAGHGAGVRQHVADLHRPACGRRDRSDVRPGRVDAGQRAAQGQGESCTLAAPRPRMRPLRVAIASGHRGLPFSGRASVGNEMNRVWRSHVLVRFEATLAYPRAVNRPRQLVAEQQPSPPDLVVRRDWAPDDHDLRKAKNPFRHAHGRCNSTSYHAPALRDLRKVLRGVSVSPHY